MSISTCAQCPAVDMCAAEIAAGAWCSRPRVETRATADPRCCCNRTEACLVECPVHPTEPDPDAPGHTHETGGAWHLMRWQVEGCPACNPDERDHSNALSNCSSSATLDTGDATTEFIREQCWTCKGTGCNRCEAVRDEVDRLLAATAARARREGAVEALREAAEATEEECWCQVDLSPASSESCEAITDEAASWLRDRADRLETP